VSVSRTCEVRHEATAVAACDGAGDKRAKDPKMVASTLSAAAPRQSFFLMFMVVENRLQLGNGCPCAPVP
jgi:hypothetical protein